MDINERIAQFRNMAQADPTNEMAHFSLASALLQAEHFDEAAATFSKCIELRPDMSKAYQLAGQALIKSNRRDEALTILTLGYTIASQRGDMLPRNGIAELLASLDAPVPEVEVREKPPASTGGGFVCQRTGRPGAQLEKPPFRGALGQRIYETISAQTWAEWLAQGTKVINEFRLDLSREDHARIYDQHMLEFLGLEEFADADQA